MGRDWLRDAQQRAGVTQLESHRPPRVSGQSWGHQLTFKASLWAEPSGGEGEGQGSPVPVPQGVGVVKLSGCPPSGHQQPAGATGLCRVFFGWFPGPKPRPRPPPWAQKWELSSPRG